MGCVAVDVASGEEDAGLTVDEPVDEESAVLEDGAGVTLWKVVPTEEGTALDEFSLGVVDDAALDVGGNVLACEDDGSVIMLEDGTTTMPVGVTDDIIEDRSEVAKENVGKG